MDVVFTVAFAGLVVGGALLVYRTAVGPTIADRVVALDSLLLVLVAGIALGAAWRGDGTYLDALVVAALLGFISTTGAARFLETRRTGRDA
jgi:multicomponent Na+:H+ antiporter subunit F